MTEDSVSEGGASEDGVSGEPRLAVRAGRATPVRVWWRTATLAWARQETATARTLAFDVPGWPGHLPGQHVIVRLRAEDGYTAQRSYSIASAPAVPGHADGDRIELTVQRLADGEVSPYLTDVIEPADQVEVRGPIGSWFTWSPIAGAGAAAATAPIQLIAGGSGIVPLMAMIRAANGTVPGRLLYSARTPADVIYADELERRSGGSRLAITYLFTRAESLPGKLPLVPAVPTASVSLPGRISADVIATMTWGPDASPAIFVCGPSGFVEAASSLLVAAGHPPASIRTERFGPTS
ncbi:MAG: oxidoreductase FAD-binding region [Actinomycetia bacterium]|nr:oxidoreductase FAD-binding region [Actinomycetes bacterium]